MEISLLTYFGIINISTLTLRLSILTTVCIFFARLKYRRTFGLISESYFRNISVVVFNFWTKLGDDIYFNLANSRTLKFYDPDV